MASSQEYWDLFKDPRWQKRRLEILERDKFTCRRCGDTKAELHVHHGYYAKGKMPWEYEPGSLWTLCKNCHVRTEECMKYVRQFIGNLVDELDEIVGYLFGKYTSRLKVKPRNLQARDFENEDMLHGFCQSTFSCLPTTQGEKVSFVPKLLLEGMLESPGGISFDEVAYVTSFIQMRSFMLVPRRFLSEGGHG